MRIPLHYSLKVAHDVVKKIDLPKEIAGHCTVASWSNCREQGLCIDCSDGPIESWLKICIAQHRSSDNIVIIYGSYRNFDISTNSPNEAVWRNNN